MSTSSATAGAKICFNTYCKEPKSEPPPRKRGWRLRTGELADLCDRCSTSYEQGSFCETFHSDSDGWRKCETCGKRVHCGCIVSASAFALRDVGGIECISCAQRSLVMGSNQMWSSSIVPSESRLKELPGKSWSQHSTSSVLPGQWRQAPNAWSVAVAAQSELHQRLSFEFDRPNSIEKLIAGGRSSTCDKRKVDDLTERPASTGLNRITIDRLVNGNSVLKPSGFSTFQGDEGSVDRLQESSLHVGDGDPIPTRKGVIHGSRFSSSAGIKIEKVPSSCMNAPPRSPMLKDDSVTPGISLSSTFSPSLEANDQARISVNQAQCQKPPTSAMKQLYPIPSNGIETSSDSQSQMRNGRPRLDGKGRNQLLPRYWPRITDQELQQISGDSNSVITPLFEKMLSASDAGRIGRLVLPKKCAEAYFPAISQPEGLPLKVQDANGKEWMFQFRFWPNNNSRMYVLEGVTPCIQSMQLQAGDIVTFSRIDPEGKLVMGFRKTCNTQNEQAHKSGNGIPPATEANNRSSKQSETMSSLSYCVVKGSSESAPSNPADRSDFSKLEKTEFIKKERSAVKSPVLSSKRKSSMVRMKSKRLRIENEDSMELKLTWEKAQELMRPPTNFAPSVVVIEGHEFEEYEEAPVVGKPTIFMKNQDGGKDQWAQCEDCLKWRKLPVDALLPPRWTCSDNCWDSDRSSCLSAQEISKEQLADLFPFNTSASRRSKSKVENDTIEASDGLDTLANLAILGEDESHSNPSQATTKHPRHRPGCTCIVCIQPPSGKGPKHNQSCCCNVCRTVKRRFRTLMLRKEKRQSEKEAETARRKQKQQVQSPEASTQEGDKPVASKSTNSQTKKATASPNQGTDDEDLLSPVKTEIDLNMQPEREEEALQVSDTGNGTTPIQKVTS